MDEVYQELKDKHADNHLTCVCGLEWLPQTCTRTEIILPEGFLLWVELLGDRTSSVIELQSPETVDLSTPRFSATRACMRISESFTLPNHPPVEVFNHCTCYCNEVHKKSWLSVYTAEFMVSAELAVTLGAWIVQEHCNFLVVCWQKLNLV